MRRVIARQSVALALLKPWLAMSAFIALSTCCAIDWIDVSKLVAIDCGARSNLGRGDVAQLIPKSNNNPIPTSKNLFSQRESPRERRDSPSPIPVVFNTDGSNGGA